MENLTASNLSAFGVATDDPVKGNFLQYGEFHGADLLGRYAGPILFVIGILGNGLALAVFSQHFMRKLLSSQLYMLLSFVDACAIGTLYGVRAVTFFTGQTVTETDMSCKLRLFLYSVFHCLSPYIMIDIGLLRCVGVILPHRASTLMTRKLFAIITTLEIVVIWACFSPYLITASVGRRSQCVITKSENLLSQILYWMNIVVTYIIPFIVISALNVGIIYGLVKARMMRTKFASASNTTPITTGIAMLLTINFTYIVLNLHKPIAWSISRPYDIYSRLFWQVQLYQEIAFHLSSLNHCLNIFLYCITGAQFRKALMYLLCCRGCRRVPNRRTSGLSLTIPPL